MAFNFNGNFPQGIKFNSKYVEKLKYNNQIVWEKKLPDEYQEVAYITGTGSQFIDTGIIPNSSTSVKIKCAIADVSLNNIVFGSRTTGTYSTSKDQFYSGINGNVASDIFAYSGTTRNSIIPNAENNKFYEWECLNNKATGTNIYPIYLFMLNNKGTTTSSTTQIKMAKFKIWNNGALVRNMIPCYRKLDDEPGLYDIVNDVFYTNQGTGKFLVGPDIVNLPSEYQQVEYLETTGSQYINTDYLPNNNTKIELTYILTAMPTQIVFGSRADADSSRAYNGVFITHRSANAKIAWGKGANSNVEIQGYNDINTQYTAFFNKNEVYFNNNLIHNFSEIVWEGNYPIFVGCVNTKGRAEYYAKCKYYGFKIWNENVLDRYLIPCYRKLDNVAGFYDLVNDNFYTNAGTGEFTVGEDVN